MKFKTLMPFVVACFIHIKLANSQKTVLDEKFSLIFRRGKETLTSFIKPRPEERNFKRNLRNNKLQKQFKESDNFFCDLRYGARSSTVPTSVHKLKPGDIDVIGAIGDSLTAANGALATYTLQVALESRGVSWSIGGDSTWKKFLTLPNILKLYNPNLYGYSINEYSNSFDKESRFNVAEAGSITFDTVHQARNLVKRMRSDRNVDMKNHWKLVTYMIGGNDFCSHICYSNDQNREIENGANNLMLVLRILKEHLPRTLVNVVMPPDVNILLKMKNRPLECQALHYIECPCMFSLNLRPTVERSLKTLRLWKQRIEDVVRMPEFHSTDDFEVNVHPFLDKADIPRFPNGNTDLTYLSRDCFHMSQKGHAMLANSLWNSMLTTEKKRQHFIRKEFEEFKCPTSLAPYLATTKNS